MHTKHAKPVSSILYSYYEGASFETLYRDLPEFIFIVGKWISGSVRKMSRALKI